MTLYSDASACRSDDTYCDILIAERIYKRHMFTFTNALHDFITIISGVGTVQNVG